jgi:RNA polymerase sigma-70 factor (ECF subfamily)
MNSDYGDLPDEILVNNARSGDARSFELLFERYYDMIHAFAYRLCLVEAEADDIAQEAFIRAARGLAGYRATATFKNWLYRIAHNAAIDSRRRAARHNEHLNELAANAESPSSVRTYDYGAIYQAVENLSTDQREAVTLVYFDGMNHREAATVMGCAETTVSWRIMLARRALKKLLKAHAGDTA